mgnify:CR=1 FL=1
MVQQSLDTSFKQFGAEDQATLGLYVQCGTCRRSLMGGLFSSKASVHATVLFTRDMCHGSVTKRKEFVLSSLS